MQLPEKAQCLRIYIGEADKYKGRNLYELIVEKARKTGLAGATALRGVHGFGANSRVHASTILRLSEDLPMVVEIVEAQEKIEPFLDWLDGVISEGLVTVEDVRVHFYRHNNGKKK